MEVGNLYRLRDCNPNDPNAPCYIELFEDSELQATDASGVTAEIQCGVNVKNSFGTLVAKLWGTVNATWTQNLVTGKYEPDVNWKVKGYWVLNGSYQWVNVAISEYPIFGGHIGVKTTGDLKYLGLPWRSYSATLTLLKGSTAPNYTCTSP